MKRFAAVCRPGLALFAGAAGGLHGGDWQSLLGNSPFGQAPATAAAAPGDFEFRGVVEEEGIYLVNLYNPVTKTAQWLPVSGRAPGIEVQAYDAGSGKLLVSQAGRPLSLSLKQARVALAGNNVSLQLTAAPAGPEAANVPEFMRNLPPEARRMLEDVRRRRALRPPFPGTEEAQPAPAPPAPAPTR